MDWLTLDPSDLGQIRMMMQSAGAWYTDADGNVNNKTVPLLQNQMVHRKFCHLLDLHLFYKQDYYMGMG